MTEFATARLTTLPDKGQGASAPAAAPGSSRKGEVVVQFNPTSLRVQRQTSQLRSGMLRKNQQVQYPSTQAATLSFDLEFDTAEVFTANPQGGGELHPVDVRTRTAPIYQFVEPPKGSEGSAPRRVRFVWGAFSFQGVITQITEEFDYFATDGTPLRAKMSLTIEEQDPRFAAKVKGSGARTDTTATAAGGGPADGQASPTSGQAAGAEPLPGATPGRAGTRSPMQNVAARDGESVQQLAARIGGDPGAWRSLMTGLNSPVGLAGGTPVVVGPELDTPAVIGRTLGFAAGAAASPVAGLAAALQFPPDGAAASPEDLLAPPVSGAPSPAEAAGFALSAAGGLAAATGTVLAAANGGAVAAARTSFAVPAAAAPPDGEDAGTEACEVDPRSLSYGQAIPLRARVHTATALDAQAGGRRSLASRAEPAEVVVSGAPSNPPWERLPPATAGRALSDAAQRGRRARDTTMRWRPGGSCR